MSIRSDIHPTPTYVVSRQAPYYQAPLLSVEIAAGGYDYCGADMLGAKYPELGEGRVYDDPRAAAKAAIQILEQWQKDEPGKQIVIAHGYTHGLFTELPESTVEEAILWAEAEWEDITRCDRCGDPVPKNWWHAEELLGEEIFCSDRCSQYALEDFFATLNEAEREEMETNA